MSEISLYFQPTVVHTSVRETNHSTVAQTHVYLTLHSGEAEKHIQGFSHITKTGQISTPYAHSTIFLLALGEQHVLEIEGQEEKNEQTVTWLEIPLASMLQSPDKGRQRGGCSTPVLLPVRR